MGNRYIEKICISCKQLTLHRVFRRYGKLAKDGAKAMRREVSRCLDCGRRTIDNKRKSKPKFMR